MIKLFCILVIFTVHIYCIGAVGKNTIENSSASKGQETFFYVKQLENYYPFLWEMEHGELKKYSIEESAKEQNSIYFFRIDEIKTNGILNKRLELAQHQGFFDIMEKIAFAQKIAFAHGKDVVDIVELFGDSDNKVACTLLVCKYIYYLKILRFAKQGEWAKALHELTIWSDVIFAVSHNGTFKKAIKRLIEHLLSSYKIPEKDKIYLLNINKKLKND